MNSVALITGGSQGLGLALAEELGTRGWAVVIDARRRDRLDAAAAYLRDRGITVISLVGDITDAGHRRTLLESARELGPLEILVNNASTLGASPLPRLDEITPSTLTRVLEVNVVAPLALVRDAAADLGVGAAVVNVTSDAATEASPGWGGYGASKAALDHASRVLAVERPDLRILSVDPGDLRTEMHQDAFPGEDIGDRPVPASVAPKIAALILGAAPSGRYRAAEVDAEVAP